jgi:hypothetical protein
MKGKPFWAHFRDQHAIIFSEDIIVELWSNNHGWYANDISSQH